MKLLGFRQLSPAELAAQTFDVAIAACGYEERAPFAASAIAQRCQTRLVARFAEHRSLASRRRNEARFQELGFASEQLSGEDRVGFSDFAMRGVARYLSGDLVRIALDFTCMTRAWSWGLLRALQKLTTTCSIEVTLIYSPATFTPPPATSRPVDSLGPLVPFDGPVIIPSQPVALVLGVGYEPDEALGVLEFVDPRESFAFITDSPSDDRFHRAIKRSNRELFSRVGAENVLRYRLSDWQQLVASLDSLCSRLLLEDRVVIAPLGPKPFGIAALLVSLVREEIDVWRVSLGPAARPQRRPPSGECIAGIAMFGPEPH